MTTKYKQIKAAIYNHKDWISTTDPEKLKNQFQSLLEQSNFTILSFNEHHFPEQGYSCFWLLAESHFAIHTFPESNTSYIELSSCNKNKLDCFKMLLKDV